MFRFAIGRFEKRQDLCAQQEVVRLFRESGGDFSSLITAIALSDVLQFHQPESEASEGVDSTNGDSMGPGPGSMEEGST